MILKKGDLPGLVRPLVVFFGAAALAFFLPFMSQRFLQKSVLEENRAEKAYFESSERISEARRERQSLAKYRAAYEDLLRRGAFGDFERIDLVEQLDQAGSFLFDLTYSVSPQQKIKGSDAYSLNVNRVLLNLELLHEGRLLDFFDMIEARTKGIPLVEGCDVERITGTPSIAFEPHLKAECIVTWVTLEAEK